MSIHHPADPNHTRKETDPTHQLAEKSARQNLLVAIGVVVMMALAVLAGTLLV
jgi:hypothetical protein